MPTCIGFAWNTAGVKKNGNVKDACVLKTSCQRKAQAVGWTMYLKQGNTRVRLTESMHMWVNDTKA